MRHQEEHQTNTKTCNKHSTKYYYQPEETMSSKLENAWNSSRDSGRDYIYCTTYGTLVYH